MPARAQQSDAGSQSNGSTTGTLSTSSTPAADSSSNDKLCTVGGKVVNSTTGEPLRKAVVELDQHEGSGESKELSALTDSVGLFCLQNVEPGSYDLAVHHTGYVRQSYGARQRGAPGAVLTLAAGQKMNDLLFRLEKTASVEGRVVDQDGDPVQAAEISVATRKTSHGLQEIEPQNTTSTDDRGEFRIWGILPGKYVIAASPPVMERSTSKGEADHVLQQSFYPGTPDDSRASVLEIKPGDELTGIDFTLVPRAAARTFKIRGHVTCAADVGHDPRVVLMLVPRDNPMMQMQPRASGAADPKTGDFELDNVLPGDYTLTAFAGHGSQFLRSDQRVTVVASDVDQVNAVITPGADIAARVIREGKSAMGANLENLVLFPSEKASWAWSRNPDAEVQTDGTFLWKNVSDGTYRIWLHSDCEACYLKSADANGVDLLSRGVAVSSGVGPPRLDLVLASDSAVVSGKVSNKDALPAFGATVVMIPAAGLLETPDYYASAVTDQNGHFELRGLRPGHYTAYAFEMPDSDTYSDPEAMKPYEDKGVAFDAGSNDRKTIDLKVIVASDAGN